MAGVGIIRRSVHIGGYNIRVILAVVLGKTVGGRFRGGGFQIIQITVLFLIIRESFPHMIQHILRKLLGFRVGHILADPPGIQGCFIHAHQTDSGKMIVKGAQITLGIRIQAIIQQLGNNSPLGF